MVCHCCGHKSAYLGHCNSCKGQLKNLGAGTQKIEEELSAVFPEARIARLDSDSAQNKSFERKTIKDFEKGEIDILIGTQIVTKGFDFSNLKLVAVIAADTLLGLQDFRADEKAFQILEQFRGRCGRRDARGTLVIQTSQPEHPVYKKLQEQSGQESHIGLLQERKDFGFPPYTRIVEVVIKDSEEHRLQTRCARLAEILATGIYDPEGTLIGVIGPYSPAIDRVADQYIRIIRINLKKSRTLSAVKAHIKTLVEKFGKESKYDGHIHLNVDPS